MISHKKGKDELELGEMYADELKKCNSFAVFGFHAPYIKAYHSPGGDLSLDWARAPDTFLWVSLVQVGCCYHITFHSRAIV